jgi:Ca2+-binding EF-hand superfamily protein
MVQRLKETFQSIDADRSGHVQISEILAAQKKKAAPRASPSQQQWSAAE